MAKRIFNILATAVFTVFLLINAAPAFGNDTTEEEEYIMGDVSTLPADFELDVTVSTDAGTSENGVPVIDGVCTFRVDRNRSNDAEASSFYDISFFEGNIFTQLYKGRSLPFTLKRNYRGIIDGSHTITFVAKDAAGKKGKGVITIQVKH